MANNYKFTGVALATVSQTALLTAASGENIIIKSIRVTNNTANNSIVWVLTATTTNTTTTTLMITPTTTYK